MVERRDAGTWARMTDAQIATLLRRQLERLEGEEPAQALGCDPGNPVSVRAAFLAITKTYHPNRFARRSPEVRATAGELYLALKARFERINTGAPGRARGVADAAATPARDGSGQRRAAAAEPRVLREPEIEQAILEARGLCERQAYGAGRRLFHRLAAALPDDPEIGAYLYYAWGREHLLQGKVEEARQAFQRALAVDPAFSLAVEALAELG